MLLSYFAWHAWKGPRGFAYLDMLHAKAEKLAGELTIEETEAKRLEAKVALMRPEKVDPDMLEDPDAADIKEITLSYTFYPVDKLKTVSQALPAPGRITN